jgi:hypothetical protein
VPSENRKRKMRESSFRGSYFHVLENQDRLNTVVDKRSYLTIIKEILERYIGLNLLNKLRIVNFEKICKREADYFPSIEVELSDVSPREAVKKAQQRLFMNRIIRNGIVYENRTRRVLKSVHDYFSR